MKPVKVTAQAICAFAVLFLLLLGATGLIQVAGKAPKQAIASIIAVLLAAAILKAVDWKEPQ